MELQDYINTNIDNYVESFRKNDLVVKTFGKENLILVKYKFNSILSEEWMKYCRGCIIDTITNKIIFIPPVKAIELEYPLNTELLKDEDISNDNTEITTLIDGTMINLFYHNDKWLMSTRSDVGCLNKWNNKVNFKDMFIDSIGNENFYDNLNINYKYSFVLIHKNNRNIANISENCVVLIEVYNNEMKKMNLDEISVNDSDKIIILNENVINNFCKLKFTSIEDLNQFFLLYDYNLKGLNINIGNNRYKILNPNFKLVRDMSINTGNLLKKYIHLKKNNNIVEYLYIYPEYKDTFKNYNAKYDILLNELYENYVNLNIHKSIVLNAVPFQLKPLVFQVHNLYLNTRKNMNRKIVNNYLLSLDTNKLLFILNYY